jgi:hypothetical protein
MLGLWLSVHEYPFRSKEERLLVFSRIRLAES